MSSPPACIVYSLSQLDLSPISTALNNLAWITKDDVLFLPSQHAVRDMLQIGSGKRSLEHYFPASYTEFVEILVYLVGSVGVYIVDEHEPVRTALAERLGHAADIQILGHTGRADRVVLEIEEKQPDIVLFEVKRSDGLGLELIRQLAALPSAPKLIVLTSYPSNWEKDAANRAGAVSYLLKDIESEELIETLSIILEEE